MAKNKKKLPKSKVGKILSVGMQVAGAIGVLKQVKEARGKGDKLEIVDAVVSAAAVITGFALLIRALREGDEALEESTD
ncbi:hypothetical protein [Streptomyces sp. SID3343]|uniref:hypothetical protein n=1 Tax=Streptomyces sp. SID3343 TaxID=2690260 RepID=UPI00136F24D9|nr:hypothetical protein [Streptomyces sp. SID3343]MYV99685.1 hypothetical protein [Streptomyces sp. SID3343]